MEGITASGRETWTRFKELQISEEQCSILEWTSWSNDYRRKTEAPKDRVTCSRSLSLLVVELGQQKDSLTSNLELFPGLQTTT